MGDAASRIHPWLRPTARAFRAVLGLFTALVLTQAALAGQFISGGVAARPVHRIIGGDVLPWLATVQMVVAVLMWRPGRGPWWPALVSLVLQVVIVVQLSLGFDGRIDLHLPVGVAIFGVTVGLLAASRGLTKKEEQP